MRAAPLKACAPKPCSGWKCVSVRISRRAAGERLAASSTFRPLTGPMPRVDDERRLVAEDDADVRDERHAAVADDEDAGAISRCPPASTSGGGGPAFDGASLINVSRPSQAKGKLDTLSLKRQDRSARRARCADALIALHFQNDICHPDGRIPSRSNRDTPRGRGFPCGSRARSSGAGAELDRSPMSISASPRIIRTCRATAGSSERSRARRGEARFLGRGSLAGFEPRETSLLVHNCNSAFRRTGLETLLRTVASTASTSWAWRRSFRSSTPCATQLILVTT